MVRYISNYAKKEMSKNTLEIDQSFARSISIATLSITVMTTHLKNDQTLAIARIVIVRFNCVHSRTICTCNHPLN